jgi:hypothetical protein
MSAPTLSRTHVHALAHVIPRRCWAPPPRCRVSPVFHHDDRDLASRPNHRWASRSRLCSSVRKMASPQRGAPPLSTSAALSRHCLVVARHRVHLFAAVCPCTFTSMHSLASELPRRHGYPSRNAAELEPQQAVTAAPLLGTGHPNFDADLLCSTATSLSLPLLSPLWFSPVAKSKV